jgi:hypothetical protein
LRPQPNTLALSRSAHAPVELRGDPPSVPWSSSSFCRVRCLDELRLLTSNAGHPLLCPQPLCFAWSELTGLCTLQPELLHRRPKASLRPHHCSSAPESPLEVSKLHMPLISRALPYRLCNCSSEQVCATATPPRRRPSYFGAHALMSCPRSCPLCHLEPSRALPSAPWPLARLRPRLRRTSVTGASGASAGCQGTLPVLAVGSRAFIRDRAA